MATSQDLLNADLNLATLDGVVTSNAVSVNDRLGQPKLTLKGFESRVDEAIAASGFYPVAGSFEAGGTITERNQVLQRTTAPEAYFSWGGALPKVVPPSSTVAGTGGEGVTAWTNRNDATLTQALSNGTAIIAGVTAAQVAEAADIAIGNFVTPEQFFTGDTGNTNADWLSACQDALATGRRVLLSRIYGLSDQLNIPDDGCVTGISREDSGFKRIGASALGGVIAFSGNRVTLSRFKVDAQNIGSAPSNRLNGVSVNFPAKDFNISQVDVYNCTGYGHVTFGTESAADVTGVYFDCRSENCQVLFEQIGALDVTLYRCRGIGVSGRTTDMFHPYAGSKRVTYIDCFASGSSSAGISATPTSGFALGPFTFINSGIDIAGGGSAIVNSTASGAAANVDMYFHGGVYKTSGGQSATLENRGIFKAFGTRFEGLGGFNCPSVPADEVDIQLIGCQIVASEDNAGAQVNALITNSSRPRISGGSIEAYNTLAGGKVAILGTAIVSRETKLVPASNSQISFIAESAGVLNFTVDSATQGVVTITLPVNSTRDKLIVSYSISRDVDVQLSAADLISWALSGGGSSITVRYAGNDPTNLKLHYRIGILP